VYEGTDRNLHVKRLQPGVKYTFRIKVGGCSELRGS
jgi:hypothetical protein